MNKLLEIQRDLKCDKGQYNSFGKYPYRSKEDILEAAKPLVHNLGCILTCTDEIVCLDNGWVYIKTTASLIDCETGQIISCDGLAREPESKKGMDASQITGTASSYAGKRALGNLFALDDTKDADALEPDTAPKKPSRKAPQNDGLKAAKARLWKACQKYAELHGRDASVISDGVKQRPDYEETEEFFMRVADELANA